MYRRCVGPLRPYVDAVVRHHRGEDDVQLRLRSSLGEDEDYPVEFFFRDVDELLPFEAYALELARGRVLDLGAGAGAHALALQERGHEVVALEVDRRLVEVQRERGIRLAVTADFRFWKGPRFDTVIMLMNGLGPVGTLDGLDRFLRHARGFLAPGGSLIVDAAEALPAPPGDAERDPAAKRVETAWPIASDYAGEAWIQLAAPACVGIPFRELYVDLVTLRSRADAAGWGLSVAFEGEQGVFLARLTPL